MTKKLILNADQLLTLEIIGRIKSYINDYDGDEIFIGGKINDQNKVESIHIISQGNQNTIPVVLKQSLKYDVVIHNHPSRIIKPSEADLEIASILENNGVAFYITNNDVSKINPVIPIYCEDEIENELNLDETISKISAKLENSGNYEIRDAQILMIEEVINTLNNKEILVCEAPTGTGKSMAYLLPAMLWSIQNKKKIVISTHTITLQEQLLSKDILIAKELLDLDIKYTLVKGRNHYLCQRKYKRFLNESFLTEHEEDQKTLIEWGQKTENGDIAELPHSINPNLWEMVSSDNDTCTNTKCPIEDQCFYKKSRRKMFTSDILIINHHILCADAAIKKENGNYTQPGLLPAYNTLIIDEAHGFEEAAMSYFGEKTTRNIIDKTFNLIGGLNKQGNQISGGVIKKINVILEKNFNSISEVNELKNQEKFFQKERKTFKKTTEEIYEKLYEFLSPLAHSSYSEKKIRITTHLANNDKWQKEYVQTIKLLLETLKNLQRPLLKFQVIIFELITKNNLIKEQIDDSFIELQAYNERLARYHQLINSSIHIDNENNIKWISSQKSKRKHIYFEFNSTPLYVNEVIKESIIDPYDSVLFTSATLSDSSPRQQMIEDDISTANYQANKFDFFTHSIGLNLSDRIIKKISLPHSFDYEKQCSFLVPLHLPDPKNTLFDEKIAHYAFEIIKYMNGKTLILCTSQKQLENILYTLKEKQKIQKTNFNFLPQGSLPRHQLNVEFQQGENNVLLGLYSFWEGVDIKGNLLSALIMTKIPFIVPTDPIHQARMEFLEKNNQSSFQQYMLPKAIIKFKQGFGRLIRSKSDQGLFCLLDNRIYKTRYGNEIISALPKMDLYHQVNQVKWSQFEN